MSSTAISKMAMTSMGLSRLGPPWRTRWPPLRLGPFPRRKFFSSSQKGQER